LIEFDTPEELQSIVSKFGCDDYGIIRLTFTQIYDKISVNIVFSKNIQKSLIDFEKRIKKFVPKISNHDYNLLENAIHENLDKILDISKSSNEDVDDFDNLSKSFKSIQNIKYQRKYEFDSTLYEAVIVDKQPKFVTFSNDAINLIEKLELSNYTIYPADTLLSQNPIPYSFESEQEVKRYLDLAKDESIDSLFDKILAVYRLYVNAKEHTMIILAADTLYTYFQNKFGTTHYNIFVGESGSGKNSALLVLKMLAYRPFYVTSVSPANYYTFLGDVQEGQGIISEDEAENIGKYSEKKNILKTGYCSGGNVPKVGFKENGNRYQDSYLTYCFKCFAMEELPGNKNNRGLFDRAFIHHFFKGDVPYNIKNIISDKESALYKDLIHLRKLLLVFKLINYDINLQEIKTNLSARDAELTHFLLRIFHGGRNFEKIRQSLSEIIFEKTTKKSNSIEARITETLLSLGNSEDNRGKKTIITFTNEEFEKTFKEIAETKDNQFDVFGSTFFLPDGTKISKYKISGLLTSKFNAKATRTNKFRGYTTVRTDIEKVSEHYKVIDEIRVIGEEADANTLSKKVTEVTHVTQFKDATSSSSTHSTLSSIPSTNNNNNNNEIDKDKDCRTCNEPDHNNDNSSNSKSKDKPNPNDNNDKENNLEENNTTEEIKDSRDFINKLEITSPTTPLNCVTGVTNVTADLMQYPCYFCGLGYKTHIDFDMGNHFLEKHRNRLLQVPIPGNIETKIDWVISETKRRIGENGMEEDELEDDED